MTEDKDTREFRHKEPLTTVHENSDPEELFTIDQRDILSELVERRASDCYEMLRDNAELHYVTTELRPHDVHGVEMMLEAAGFEIHSERVGVFAPPTPSLSNVPHAEVFETSVLSEEAFGVHPEAVVRHPTHPTDVLVRDGTGVVHVEVCND